MSLMALTAGLLTFRTLLTGILPVVTRPASLMSRSNVRTSASLTSSVEEILPSGSNVEVLNITVGTDGNYWYYVQPNVEETLSGWIRSNLI